ncbi:Innexin inx3 [Eumeta japonica]|uniref:Innexin n=1 Tax=Eumeta variegata TaxID=151549 RepID=A0A4C1W1X6_EUMVA|nr:Innexin inx3 [Eumeta japonica]
MAIFGMVSAVAGFVKVRYLIDKAIIDNMVFRLHYRITSAILFLCCILVTANNLIGDPISCINDGAIPGHVLNTYCWITYTFTLPNSNSKLVAHPGLGNDYNEEKRIHAYYQWVPFMLFFQGILFYAPHWIWKTWEEGKVRMISDGMRGTAASISDDRNSRQVGNIFFLDTFLGGAFLTYGTEVVKFSNMNQEQRTDPMIEVFPRVTKCTFHKFGASGTIQKHDALCVLALNILNEKIFIFLWFWFIILSVVSGLALLYSAAVILLPRTRETILKRRFRFGTPTGVEALIRKTQYDLVENSLVAIRTKYLLVLIATIINRPDLIVAMLGQTLDQHEGLKDQTLQFQIESLWEYATAVGDFLLLHLLGQNMSLRVFGEVLDELSRRLHLGSNPPSAPSTLEMAPMYPVIDKLSKESET